MFSLTQLNDFLQGQSNPTAIPYSTVLSDVTIYTSLESCSQCSGIMALGSVKEVVFLQRDPGQNSVGNILRQLSPVGGRYLPPLPIPGDQIGMSCFDRLGKGYDTFAAGVAKKPFYIDPKGKEDASSSITSYLCTDDARQIVRESHETFGGMTLRYPNYRPVGQDGQPVPSGLSNSECYEIAKRFLQYAIVEGHRGTPHKL